MMAKRKRVSMIVTVSCPTYLTAAQARKEVRALINDQAFWGHTSPEDRFDEIEGHNFKAVAIKTAAIGAAKSRKVITSTGHLWSCLNCEGVVLMEDMPAFCPHCRHQSFVRPDAESTK